MSNTGPKLRKRLNQVIVPKERVIGRGRGCWNCIHWHPNEPAKKLWAEKRQNDLNTAVGLALESAKGENDVRVKNIRAMVDSLDHLVASGHVGLCRGNGKTEDGQPVGDFTTHALLCGQWSGVQGASMATSGAKLDLLPRDLAQKMDNGVPALEDLADKLKN